MVHHRGEAASEGLPPQMSGCFRDVSQSWGLTSLDLVKARQSRASSTRCPPMAYCRAGWWPAGGVSTMADGHAEPTNRAPLTPLGLQPTSGEVPLECSWEVGIHMVLHGTYGLPPRRAGSIRAWARRHRAVDPPRSPQARIIDLHGRARRPSSCRCGSASRRVATPPPRPLSTDRRPRWWGHGLSSGPLQVG